MRRKKSKKTLTEFLWCILFPPVGIIMLLKNKKRKPLLKTSISILYFFYITFYIGFITNAYNNFDINNIQKGLNTNRNKIVAFFDENLGKINLGKNINILSKFDNINVFKDFDWFSNNDNNIKRQLIDVDNINNNTGELTVYYFDVGQADSIFIDYGDYDILIDGGNNDDGDLVVQYLKELNTDDIELLIGTHVHEDHIGGLDQVLKNFDVEKVIDSGQRSGTKTYQDYIKAIKDEGCELIYDDDIRFQIDEDLTFDVIETGDDYNNTNDNSVLCKMKFKNISFLFTGDMESDVERHILNKDIQADVLKVGHHGSSTSSCMEFLKKVNPNVAIISAGANNKYKHPHKSAVENILNFTDEIYGTWENGTIIFNTDGYDYTISAKEKVTIEDAHAVNE